MDARGFILIRPRLHIAVLTLLAVGIALLAQSTPALAVTSADLSVSVSDTPDPVVAGAGLRYTITAHNAGPGAASTVMVGDTFPSGLTFTSFVQESGPAFTLSHSTTAASATIGSLASGATAVFRLVLHTGPSLPDGATITNIPTISASGSSDPDSGNNSATATTTVTTEANLAITASSDDPDPVSPEQKMHYTMTVQNLGPSDAENAVFTDFVPSGMSAFEFGQTSGPAFALAFNGVKFTATISSFPAGATAVFVSGYTAVHDAPRTVHHATTVSSDTPDPDTVDNTDTEDTSVAPLISIGDVTVTEGNADTTPLAFRVTFNHGFSRPLEVDYATVDGTARHPADFREAHGTVTFAPNQTSKIVTVLARGETVFEPNETFGLRLSLPGLGLLGDGQGVGTILNDDAQPTVSIGNASRLEGDRGESFLLRFPVTLSNPTSQQVTVHFHSGGGTARAGPDYQAVAADLLIPPGGHGGFVSVPLHGDNTPEPNETVRVTLSSPVGASLGDAIGIGTIVNDDTAGPTTGGASRNLIRRW